jgi:hypothetical protein
MNEGFSKWERKNVLSLLGYSLGDARYVVVVVITFIKGSQVISEQFHYDSNF